MKESREKIRDVDFKLLQQELILALRGSKSQRNISQSLGYDFNKVAKWESGSHRILWDDFLQFISLQELSLTRYFEKTFSYHDELSDIPALFFHLTGSVPMNHLAITLGVSKPKLYRLFSGQVQAYLEDVLKIILLSDNYFHNFFDSLCDRSQLPSLKNFFTHLNDQELFYSIPETPLVLRCLELSDYRVLKKHDNQFISDKLGLSLEKVELILEQLETQEMIERRGELYYVLTKTTTLNSSPYKVWKDKLFWISHHQKIMESRIENFSEQGQKIGNNGYLIVALTNPAKEELLKLMQKQYQEVVSLISSEINRLTDDGSVLISDICYYSINLASFLRN